jgi:FkbM family methyltransferase
MDRKTGPSLKLRAKHSVKTILRKIVGRSYALVRPFVRPLLTRYREYLHAILVQHSNQLRHELVADLSHWLPRSIAHEQRMLAAGLHQALQASRETVREDLFELQRELADVRRQLGDFRDDLAQWGHRSGAVGEVAEQLDRIEALALASARRVAIHSNSGTVLLKSEVGYVLCCDSDHRVLAGLIDTGDLERGTRLFIERYLRPGDVFVDVGAHIGLMSLAAARAMKGKGKIFAFEPHPKSRWMLERSFWINGFSDILVSSGAAVSDQPGTATLFLGASSGHHSLYALDGSTGETLDVPLVALDSSLPHDQAISLLKIDAEGAELDVVRGGHSLLTRDDEIGLIVEFGSSHLRRAGHTIDDWLRVFAELGYQYRKINIEDGTIEEISLEDLKTSDSTNLFFAKTGSGAWTRVKVQA